MHPSWWLTFLQIILESLPISSSTHIGLFSSYFLLPFEQALDHAVHGITLVILIIFWREKIKKLLQTSWHEWFMNGSCMFIASLFPTIIYFSPLKEKTSFISPFYGLLINAALLWLCTWPKTTKKIITPSLGIYLGIAQSIALLPGISRMGITYSFGRFLQYSAEDALWLSCLVEIPLCLGGILLALKNYTLITPLLYNPYYLFIGISISALISYAALYLTYLICTKNKTWVFSLYLLLLAFLAL